MTTVVPETEETVDRVILEETETSSNDNNPPVKRHIVNPPMNLHIWKPGMEAQDVVDFARVHQIEVTALCGIKFVPTRNPEDVKETCDVCIDIAGKIMTEG